MGLTWLGAAERIARQGRPKKAVAWPSPCSLGRAGMGLDAAEVGADIPSMPDKFGGMH